jgi:succinate-semialdehyde dehydrogenase / glutarate-semialdehyde dehydrogenase
MTTTASRADATDRSRRPIYIDGAWRSDGRAVQVVRNPADSSTIAEYCVGTCADAEEALAAASRAFPAWSALSAAARGVYLHRVAALLRERKETIARTLTLENGKPIRESRAEVEGAAQHFDWFAEEGRRSYGRIPPPGDPAKRHLVVRQPIGVVAVITPWNFPLVLWARKVAPALAAGCTVVAKPAGQTTLVAIEGTACCHDAGLPAGVLNLVTGPAREISTVFLEYPACRKVSFTGSTEVGRELIAKSAARVTKLSLELGGQAPAIVFADADFDRAVEGALWSKFRNNGQSCIAANRIFVEQSIYDRFAQAFIDRAAQLRVRHGLDEDADVGAVVDAGALARFEAHVQDAVGHGARLALGGARLTASPYGQGHFFAPTVLLDATDEMRCMREETFGPIAPLTPFATEEDVIRRANDTIYGLVAYVFTRDLGRAFRVSEALEAGTIGVNDPVPSTTIAPFGGFKQSGLDRECGSEGLDAYMETKHVSLVF